MQASLPTSEMDAPSSLTFTTHGPANGMPLILIHGWTLSGTSEAYDFEPIFTCPTASNSNLTNYKRIYPNLPGHSTSPLAPSTSLTIMLSRLALFVESQILPSRFLIAGTSVGGPLARALAFRFADAVDGLLLRVPVTHFANADRDVDQPAPLLSTPTAQASVSDHEHAQLGDLPVYTQSYIAAARLKFDSAIAAAISAADAGLAAIRNDPEAYSVRADMHSAASPYRGPALIVAGRQDTVVGYRDALALLESYPRATLAVLDRVDHGFPVDAGQKEVFRAMVTEWLARVEEVKRERAG